MRRLLLCLIVVCPLAAVPSCGNDAACVDDGDAGGGTCDCGPCGSIANGDTTISGDPRLDGFFAAVGRLHARLQSMRAELEWDVYKLAVEYGVEAEGMTLPDLVAEVKAEIETEINASISGGLQIAFVEPTCSADVRGAFLAQAQCEKKLGCEVDPDCGEWNAEFTCDGQCRGDCDGTCSVCAHPIDGLCVGTCVGACLALDGQACEGTCYGSCNGECTLNDSDGDCQGYCNGECLGSCVVPGGGECDGECCGECVHDSDTVCELGCSGQCNGDCSGLCAGTVTPPSCAAEGNCVFAEGCQTQAASRAAVGWMCTAPTLELRYEASAALDQAELNCLLVRMERLEQTVSRIARRHAELEGLIGSDPDSGGEAAMALLSGMVEQMIFGSFEDLEIPACLMPCVIPAFEEVVEILSDLATESAVLVEAHISLLVIVGAG